MRVMVRMQVRVRGMIRVGVRVRVSVRVRVTILAQIFHTTFGSVEILRQPQGEECVEYRTV